MTLSAIIVSVVIGLVMSEHSDVTPWLADKLVRRAARRMYADKPERAEVRQEEWAALLADRPGKLFKLGTALGFGLAAVLVGVWRNERIRSGMRWVGLHLIVYPLVVDPDILEVILRARLRSRAKAKTISVVLTVLVPGWLGLAMAFMGGQLQGDSRMSGWILGLLMLGLTPVLIGAYSVYVRSLTVLAVRLSFSVDRDMRRQALSVSRDVLGRTWVAAAQAVIRRKR